MLRYATSICLSIFFLYRICFFWASVTAAAFFFDLRAMAEGGVAVALAKVCLRWFCTALRGLTWNWGWDTTAARRSRSCVMEAFFGPRLVLAPLAASVAPSKVLLKSEKSWKAFERPFRLPFF